MPPDSFESLPDPFPHKDVELLISRAWDGDLSAEESERLAEHLRQCPECSARSKRFLHFLTRLAEFTDPGETPAEEQG
jgi:anti-sigma factor RsiW